MSATIEAILPVAPLQEGLLFHALYDSKTADAYIVQVVLSLEGTQYPRQLRGAAEALLKRHPNLRASFVWTGASDPVQVIPDDVTTPWDVVDLRGFAPGERAQKLNRLLFEDRLRRFDPRRSPLLRFTLFQLTDTSSQLAFTHHHLL